MTKMRIWHSMKILTLSSFAALGAGDLNGPSVIGVNEAKAVVGRPLTPLSYAGVARRTTRRAVYGTSGVYAGTAYAATVATLPGGCVTTIYGGVSYHRCGSVYYQPVYDGPNVVYAEVPAPM